MNKKQYYFLAILFSFASIIMLNDYKENWLSLVFNVLSIVAIVFVLYIEQRKTS